MINTIKQEYNKLPELDRKVLRFSGQLIFGELSKIIILFLFFTFFHMTKEFVFSTLALIPIRCKIGGLHCRTYLGCLSVTLMIYISAIMILPATIPLTPIVITVLLLCCASMYIYIGPIINPTRPKLSSCQIKQAKSIAAGFIIGYIMLSCALHFNHYVICGVWIIIIQTLQLIAAHIQRKRRS